MARPSTRESHTTTVVTVTHTFGSVAEQAGIDADTRETLLRQFAETWHAYQACPREQDEVRQALAQTMDAISNQVNGVHTREQA